MQNAAEGHWARLSAPPAGPQQKPGGVSDAAAARQREARSLAFCNNATLRAEMDYAIRVGVDC